MSDAQEERAKRDEQIRETIMAKLVETGEKDKLKDMLRERLQQCGWRDELKEYCKEVIRKKGLERVTVEELVADITPQGRGMFPVSALSPFKCKHMPDFVLFCLLSLQLPFPRKLKLSC